jgi:hypothetical protein
MARWHRRLYLFRVKTLTAAQHLRFANISRRPLLAASAHVVFVL